MLEKVFVYFKNINKQFIQIISNQQKQGFTTNVNKVIPREPLKNEDNTKNDSSLTNQFPKYTEGEKDKILNLINDKKLEEIQSYDITQTRANKLHAWKTKNGPLQSLEDILLVEGFSLRVLKKFFQSLLNEDVNTSSDSEGSQKILRTRIGPYLIPSMDDIQRFKIRSSMSIRIGVTSVTWARLELSGDKHKNGPNLLTHWQHHDIADKKLHLNDLVKRCLYVNHLMPNADCYVFENPQMAQVSNNPGNAEQQNINIQKAQITALMSYALSARERNEPIFNTEIAPRVFYLRRFLTARLFNHLIGTERVSSEESILNLMRVYYNTENIPLDQDANPSGNDNTLSTSSSGNVQFTSEFRSMFSRAERFHREFLGQALLLNLAFVRLILLQDPKSIQMTTRKSKNKNNMEE